MDTSRYSKIPAKNYKRLPEHPSLEHLKNQAKDLLAAFKAGKEKAGKRFRRFIPAEQLARGPRLKDAQEVVVREYTVGPYKIDSWRILTRYVDAVINLTPATLKLWLEATISPDNAMRHLAIKILNGKGRTDDMIAIYFEGLEHPDSRIRNFCIGELDHSDIPVDEKFTAALKKAAEDANPNVRRSAIHTMFCQRCKSAPAQVDVDFLAKVSLYDESPKTRWTTALALVKNPDREEVLRAVRRLRDSATDLEIIRRANALIGEVVKDVNSASGRNHAPRL